MDSGVQSEIQYPLRQALIVVGKESAETLFPRIHLRADYTKVTMATEPRLLLSPQPLRAALFAFVLQAI